MSRRMGFGLALVLALAGLHAGPAAAGALFGVRAGMVISGMRTDSDILPESKLGPGAGVFLTFGVSDLISIQPEVLFVSKGGSWGESEATDTAGNVIGTFESLVVVDYVEVPVLMRFTPPVGGTLHPVLLLGPTLGIEMNEKLKVTGAVEGSQDTDAFTHLDFGGAVGLGFEAIGPGGIWSLEGRYTHGFTPISEDYLGDEVRNWGVLITLGFARAIN